MTLEKWGITGPRTKPRPATKADILPLLNTFQRVRKLKGLERKFTNVEVWYAGEFPIYKSPDEWTLVVEIIETERGSFEITAVPLGTIDKARAVRRAYGWGLRDEDGNLCWPPEGEEDWGDVDDDPYVAYGPDPDEMARLRGRLPY